MKHTKRNWITKEGQIYPEQTGKTLALIPYFDLNNEEQQANALLIAAAPDMLSVLKEAVDHAHVYDTNPALMELFTAIIHKATNSEEK